MIPTVPTTSPFIKQKTVLTSKVEAGLGLCRQHGLVEVWAESFLISVGVLKGSLLRGAKNFHYPLCELFLNQSMRFYEGVLLAKDP